MTTTRARIGAGLALAATAALVGCDQPKDRPPPSQEGLPAALTTPPPAAAGPQGAAAKARLVAEPLPAQPAWAQALLGKPLRELYPKADGQCMGNTDIVDWRYAGDPAGVMIEGWAWDVPAKQVVARVVLTDENLRIVGAGETGSPRRDVVKRVPQVTTLLTGWKAVTARAAGPVLTFGLMGDGQTTCVLGRLDL